MSGEIVLPDPSGVDPYDNHKRRLYMEEVFRSQDLWDYIDRRPKFPRVREKAKDKVCEMLDGKGWHNASDPYFEWAVDERIWVAVPVRRGKIDIAQAPWPFADRNIPPLRDLTAGKSQTYKEWRESRGKSTEELSGRASRAHRFREAREETMGNVSAIEVNTVQPPTGQTASSTSLVGQDAPASVQAQPGPTADVVPRVPAPKQEMDREDHMMTGTVDLSIPSWPLPATHENRMQRMQGSSDADRGIDGARSSGRWPESEHGQGTPVLDAARPIEMTATVGASALDLAAPEPPLPSYTGNPSEHVQRELQELREKVASQGNMIEELREEHRQSESRNARILGQMRIELNAMRDQLRTR
ncbi:hypothetical protein NW768_011583 [Fusarium equiseti]|uniref:Uncharacterized protein n=1 Tax=Fusarium equiseti TaxID=61235 RepID=A0ABQ8QXP7_FUSEQ|nr:hypothetical protein NW768_011583 [Fusarium equiseti]